MPNAFINRRKKPSESATVVAEGEDCLKATTCGPCSPAIRRNAATFMSSASSQEIGTQVCTINGDQSGLSPKVGDPKKPYLTATQSQLKVIGGIATLTCQYKP